MGPGGEPIWNASGGTMLSDVPSKPTTTIWRVAILTGEQPPTDHMIVPLNVQALAQDWPAIAHRLAGVAELLAAGRAFVAEGSPEGPTRIRAPSAMEYGEIARRIVASR